MATAGMVWYLAGLNAGLAALALWWWAFTFFSCGVLYLLEILDLGLVFDCIQVRVDAVEGLHHVGILLWASLCFPREHFPRSICV